VDKRVLTYSGLGVKQVAAKPATVVQPFKLTSGIHHEESSASSEFDTTVFHAQPAPKDILQGIVVSRLHLTLIALFQLRFFVYYSISSNSNI